MFKSKIYPYSLLILGTLAVISCKTPATVTDTAYKAIPEHFGSSTDTTNTAAIAWKNYFKDPNLALLIEIALKNNQELKITLQEIEIAKNDILVRKGALLPTVGLRAGTGVEKVGRYTSQGAGDATTEITPGKEFPDPLTDFNIGAYAKWEVDIWKKLRNSKKAAVNKYLATIEGKNFVVTNLIAEVANSYYELMALDNQLDIIKQTIVLQQNALEIVKIQKQAARTTELAVQKFQAEVFSSKSMEFEILQKIVETENRIHFLLGQYPEKIKRDSGTFMQTASAIIATGTPSQLLSNRPDIKQAELALTAAKLDVKVARAAFYPSLDISAAFGLQAFKTSYLAQFPESLLYNLIGDIAAPLINRNTIKAEFASANSRQLQALYAYQRTVLNAYLEVATQMATMAYLEKRYQLKAEQVAAMNQSISIAGDLFQSARADYFEVLMTQRDALDSKLELIETKIKQRNAFVLIYRDLGGGWQ
ncbi:TolC family protein [Flavobacterium crassostreae]|uniref:RND transporter n=1 Tax=Flavobacterium crassostreae TaxID=1763534 RepID=A0A1B9DYQ5_9FLAO|nr:efflux transporter outer membrane subunit [Flavobacterium crassostreae]OCB74825.1 RND transporter [Flavobacterium crassostreae]